MVHPAGPWAQHNPSLSSPAPGLCLLPIILFVLYFHLILKYGLYNL